MGRLSDDGIVAWLISTHGISTTQSIIDKYGGERPYIPKKVNFHGRDEQIKQDYHEIVGTGLSSMDAYRRLSNEYNLSMRRIREIAKKSA